MSTRSLPAALLAKIQRQGRPALTLHQHSLDTETAATRLFRLDGRLGRNWCRFFRIPTEQRARFLLHLRIAALFHDLGKANEEFYAVVSRTVGRTQTLRHEHLSALILHLPEVRRWLATNNQLDLEVITAAVLSHHLKADQDGCWKWGQPRGAAVLGLYLDHPEVGTVLQRVAEIAEIGPPPELKWQTWSAAEPWQTAWATGVRAAREFGRALRRESSVDRRALLLAVKAGLIAADSAASGLVREGHPLVAWIDDIVAQPEVAPAEIDEKIIRPRTEQVARRQGRPFTLHRFQQEAAGLGARGLLLAACGTGKTLAAWKWAEAQAHVHEVGKVIFLYPTRGTATEGFRDYVGWAPEAEAALMHGTAKYELEAMAANPAESVDGKQIGMTESEARLFALAFWSKRFFSATVDQFLSFMEHHYASLCLLPVLADSLLVVDEVHSFDRRMFNSLVAFLHTFDLPVLCMTATLPPSRRKELEDVGLRVYPSAEERAGMADLEAQECHPRYRLEPVDNPDEAFHWALEAYRAGRRVLWVVNQIARCQKLAARLSEALGEPVLCYHSRFKLQDRQRIHADTVAAFKQSERSAIAVTTQVCEMSLDLDADVLVTELAPVTSLVQRFGRANRRPIVDKEFRATVHTYEPEDPRPYGREELDAARKFLADIGRGDISQRTLAESLERHAPEETKSEGSTAFLTGGYFATPGTFRDADEFTTPCVLDDELASVEALHRAGRPIDGWVLNVPRRTARMDSMRPAWLPAHLGVASAAHYDPMVGFRVDDGEQG
jgi:CRISPR-associated endonuclease/helicase Cas3